VADPVVISPSVPRFLSPGDSLEMPVTFTNTTSMPLALNVSCATTGNLKLSNNASSQLTIAPSAEARFVWNIVASSTIGQGSIDVKVNTGKEIFSDKTAITIRPPSSLVKETSNGVAEGNTTVQVASDFISGSTKTNFVLSASPMVQFTDQLIYLLDYPHGCLEQTVSIAFPQLYYGSLAKSITNKSGVAYNPDFNIQEAIRKIEGMQIYNGSMTYWPGSVIENWWATAYALHFLTEARKAGYAVNENTINRTFEYLKSKVKTKETETVYFANANNVIEKQVRVKREIIYSLYLMALNDRRDLSMMNYYKANHSQLTLDSKYMLALSYLAIGDTKSYLALLPEKFAGEKSQRSLSGNFSSYIRDQALALNCLLETDPDNAQIPTMARTLSQLIRGEKWLSTQERAFALLALGKFAKRSTSANVRATVFADGKQIGTFNGNDLVINNNLAGKKIEIRTEGKGQLYYFLEVSGIKESLRLKDEDSKLNVRRSYFNRFGQQINNNFKQGDLIVVQLALSSPTGIDVENVVLTDLIPSGFEIENPRIVDDREMTWIKSKSQPDYFDIRDDRINLYTQAGKTIKYFYYTVRAVNTGSFVVGPVSADAMYDGEFHSYSGGGRVKVVK
ncbi:MAG TPA: alpha-2-macroglobulin family protein, partial [Bacteroidia bacterium]|nr:alpha-2-macroglobulin family protein [Bacteroidia bacterium]